MFANNVGDKVDVVVVVVIVGKTIFEKINTFSFWPLKVKNTRTNWPFFRNQLNMILVVRQEPATCVCN